MFSPTIERHPVSGALIVSHFVRDSAGLEWLHTEIFFSYTRREARRIYCRKIAANGWELA